MSNKDKNIILIFDSETRPKDKDLADEIMVALSSAGYHVEKVIEIKSVEQEGDLVDDIIKKNGIAPKDDDAPEYDPQLILSVNMAGFRTRMSDGSPYINKLPLDIIVIIDKLTDEHKTKIDKRLNITTHFLLKKEDDYNYIKKNRPDLFHVKMIKDVADDMVKYVDEVGLRF